MPAVLLDSQKIILESGGFGSILVFEFRTIGYINATYLVGNNYYSDSRMDPPADDHLPIFFQ